MFFTLPGLMLHETNKAVRPYTALYYSNLQSNMFRLIALLFMYHTSQICRVPNVLKISQTSLKNVVCKNYGQI
jgi:hypothetical protein